MTTAHEDAAAALLAARDASARLFGELVGSAAIGPQHVLVLRAIEAGARSLPAVADATDSDVAAVSSLIDGLVAAELVRRTPNPDDRRHVVLRLTSSGQRLVDRSHAQDAALRTRLTSALDDDEAAALAQLVRRVVGAQVTDQPADRTHVEVLRCP